MLIIDDEQHAIDLLTLYVQKHGELEIVGSTNNPWQGKKLLEKEDIDLLFLDIQMPELTGLQLLDLVPKTFNVIITSAYQEYALDGYKYKVSDYLLKPFSYQQFCEAIENLSDNKSSDVLKSDQEHIMLKGDAKNLFHRINCNDLYYLEGMRNYVAYHQFNGRIVSHITMGEAELSLPKYFIRIHRSYIINTNHIERVDGNSIYINGKSLPLGKTYKKDFYRFMGFNQQS